MYTFSFCKCTDFSSVSFTIFSHIYMYCIKLITYQNFNFLIHLKLHYLFFLNVIIFIIPSHGCLNAVVGSSSLRKYFVSST